MRPIHGLLIFLILSFFSGALAAIRPEKVHVSESKKTQVYIQDGMFVGGDRAIDEVMIRDIRRASNSGFERIVIDLEGNREGESVAIPRPPYYQVAVSADEKRLVCSIWGHPKLAFNSRKVISALKKSSLVDRVDLFPRLEEEMWSFVLELKPGNKSVEVFELSNPVRVIVDIRKSQ